VLPLRLEQGIRRILFRRRIGIFKKRTVEHTYFGYPLKVSIQDELAEAWYDSAYICANLPEIEFLQRGRLKKGARVFDLGAHQCVIAMILSRVVGDSGSVVAVEGTRHNFNVAMENRRLNGIANLTIKNAVAAEEAGLKMSFSATLNGSMGDSLLPVEVTSTSIDSLAGEHGVPDVVFIDVEGYECQVLAGGKKAFAAGADFLVEVHTGVGLERHGSVEKVLAYFPDSKYELFCSSPDRTQFWPLTDRSDTPGKSFFLIAFAR